MGAMGQPGSPAPPPPWTVEFRGAFTFGRCLVCGFESPARRARYSAEADMRAHELLCGATESLSPASAHDAGLGPAD
jgi:hypothetical protein